MKCPGCGEKKKFWLIEKKFGKILVRTKLQCQNCGLTFKYFDFRGWKR